MGESTTRLTDGDADGKMTSTAEEVLDPKEAFRKLERKIASLGISGADLASLRSYKRLQAPTLPLWPKVCGVLGTLLLLILLVLVTQWPVQRRTIADWWFNYYDLDIEKENCVIQLNDVFLDVVRPPVDCSMCENVEQVDRVTNLQPDLFESKYAYSGRPVVIADGMTNWTAKDTFSFEFFKSIYGDDSPALLNIESNCQFFPYKTDFGSLGEVFNMSKERAEMKDKPWYIGWSNCDSSAANILRQYYTRPYFLPTVAESSKTDWIFMGSPGYGAHMHIDNVRNPSWQAQITGVKRWMLEPPPECYHLCKNSMDVVVKPGEIIVLDTNRWFHSTVIMGDDMSITIGSEFD